MSTQEKLIQRLIDQLVEEVVDLSEVAAVEYGAKQMELVGKISGLQRAITIIETKFYGDGVEEGD